MRERTTRVLIVYPHLPHYRYEVFRALEQTQGLEIEFAAAPTSQDGSIPTIPAEALKCFHPLRNKMLGPFLWQVGLLTLLTRRRPNVVIFLGQSTYASTWAGAMLTRIIGGSVLFWTIGWHRPDRGMRRVVRLIFYRLASKLLLYGNTGKDLGVAMGYPRDRMRVIYNSSSKQPSDEAGASEFSKQFASRLPPAGRQVVCAVIRLSPARRLDLLLRAAASLRAIGRPIEVLLVGTGSEERALSDLATKLDVPLWLPGPAYQDADIKLVYERSLITVIPAFAGLSILQSLRFGRPVITHSNLYEQGPECEAIRPGLTGDFYHLSDLASLQETIKHWLERQDADPDSTARECKRTLLRHWNATDQANAIVEEILSAGRRGAN